MNLDKLMLVAFGIFIVLLLWRMHSRLKESSGIDGRDIDGKKSGWTDFRKWWQIVLLVVLCGLLFYMVPLLWKDFQSFEECEGVQLVLRCLIFILTIYILFVGIRKWLKERKVNIK